MNGRVIPYRVSMLKCLATLTARVWLGPSSRGLSSWGCSWPSRGGHLCTASRAFRPSIAYKKEGWKLRFKETMHICSKNINEKYDPVSQPVHTLISSIYKSQNYRNLHEKRNMHSLTYTIINHKNFTFFTINSICSHLYVHIRLFKMNLSTNNKYTVMPLLYIS
jgi:hypothetical protein